MGRVEGLTLKLGGVERVGFSQKSSSISAQRTQLLIGACARLGLTVCWACIFLAQVSLINCSSLATIRSKASSNSAASILSFLSILNISLNKEMNQLLKSYCPRTFQNLSSSLACPTNPLSPPYSSYSGNSLVNQNIQLIFVLAERSARPRINSDMSKPAPKMRARQSSSLLVSTDSGEEYLRSCSSTRSSFDRSVLVAVSRCAILRVRQWLEVKREEGRIQRGSTFSSVNCRVIWMMVLLILNISSLVSSPRMTSSKL